jgi:hypothetical protein
MAQTPHPFDDAIPVIEPGTFDDAEVTQAHTPLSPSDLKILGDLVKYARLRPACAARSMANVLKHFALPEAKDDAGRIRLMQVREYLLGMAAQMDSVGG